MKVNKSIVSSSLFIILALVIWFLIPAQIQIKGESTINAQFLPRLIAITMFCISVILLVQSIVKAKKNPTDEDTITLNLREEFKVIIVFIILVIYVYIMPLVGFIMASAFACGLILLIMKVKKWPFYIVSLTLIIAVNYLFKLVLNIQLP